jgi:excisionase family DNA binding protein
MKGVNAMDKHAGGRPKKTAAPISELTKLYYSMDEAAEILSIHRNTVKNRIKAGELEAVKIGRQWRIPKEVLEFKSPM